MGLQVINENLLFARYRKCEFWLRSVTVLGHIIFSEGVEVPRKTEAVKNLPRPLTPTDIRIFLCLAGYLSKVCGWFCVHCISLDYFDPKE